MFCQTLKKESIGKDFGSDCSIFFDDGIKYFSSPLRFSGRDWLYALAGSAATGGIMTLDDEIKKSVAGYDNFTSSSNMTFLKSYGEIRYIAPASIVIYVSGLLARESEIRVTGRMLLQSLVYSGLLVTGFKFVTGRTRPYLTNNQFDFKWFQTNNDFLSFPSGHAAIAFSVSAVLAEKIDKWWARLILYPIAAGTAYSRIRDNEHWLSDAIVGSLAGFSAGYFVVHNHDNKTKHTSGLDFNFSLNGAGIIYNF